jgi:hypothetical protein
MRLRGEWSDAQGLVGALGGAAVDDKLLIR